MRSFGYTWKKGQKQRRKPMKEMTLDKLAFQELLNEVAKEEEKQEKKLKNPRQEDN